MVMPGMMWMALLGLVSVAAVVVLGVLIVRAWSDRGARGGGDTSGRSALVMLEERFARGEIDREEFEQRRAVLRSDGVDRDGRQRW